jgi:hypothetical protein
VTKTKTQTPIPETQNYNQNPKLKAQKIWYCNMLIFYGCLRQLIIIFVQLHWKKLRKISNEGTASAAFLKSAAATEFY